MNDVLKSYSDLNSESNSTRGQVCRTLDGSKAIRDSRSLRSTLTAENSGFGYHGCIRTYASRGEDILHVGGYDLDLCMVNHGGELRTPTLRCFVWGLPQLSYPKKMFSLTLKT
eukprot:1190689-Prorocentrum_minimum.AAC.1